MDNKQATAEWIAQQRQTSEIVKWIAQQQQIIEIVNMTHEDAPGSVVPLLKQLEKSQTAALDALEAAYAEIARLTAERDAAKQRAESAEQTIYEIIHDGLCVACSQGDAVCEGDDGCTSGCPYPNLCICGNVAGAIPPDELCAEDAPAGAGSELRDV